jgi:hypothetical protein
MAEEESGFRHVAKGVLKREPRTTRKAAPVVIRSLKTGEVVKTVGQQTLRRAPKAQR